MIIVDTYPLLLLLSETAKLEGLPLEWIDNISTDFTALLALIDETWMQAKDEYVKCTIGRNYLKYQFSRSANRVSLPQPVGPVYITVTRKCGQPQKSVDPKLLHKAFQKGRHISTTVLANILGINQKTLQAQKMNWELIPTSITLVMPILINWFKFTTKKTHPEGTPILWGIFVLHMDSEFNGNVLSMPSTVLTSWDKRCSTTLERKCYRGNIACLDPTHCDILMDITN